jgi:putative transposase
MKKRAYPSEYKVKVVLEMLKGAKTVNEIASEQEINPNQLTKWKRQFMEKAPNLFDEPRKERIQHQAEQAAQEKETQMLKTIGQLTMERDYLKAVQEKIEGKKGFL